MAVRLPPIDASAMRLSAARFLARFLPVADVRVPLVHSEVPPEHIAFYRPPEGAGPPEFFEPMLEAQAAAICGEHTPLAWASGEEPMAPIPERERFAPMPEYDDRRARFR